MSNVIPFRRPAPAAQPALAPKQTSTSHAAPPASPASTAPWGLRFPPDLSPEETTYARQLISEALRLPADEMLEDESGGLEFSAQDFVDLTKLHTSLGAPLPAQLNAAQWGPVTLAITCVVINAMELLVYKDSAAIRNHMWQRLDPEVVACLQAVVQKTGQQQLHWNAVARVHARKYGHLPGHS
jgi:hypothetical protein